MTLSAAALNRSAEHPTLGKDNLLSLFESAICPGALITSLWATAYYFEGEILPAYLLLAVLTFALTFPGESRLQNTFGAVLIDIFSNWVWIAGLLGVTGYATGYIKEFSLNALTTWLWAAPATEIVASLGLQLAAPWVLKLQGHKQRALIVGMNEQGLALATKLQNSKYSRIEFAGFIDSRNTERLNTTPSHTLLGKISELAHIAQHSRIQIIYLSLPMASQPRILQILDELKDTTASIYFVPDMFVTDLIQGHPSSVCGMPVISVCETPFRGFDGVVKRMSDIVFSILILLMIAPILVVIAVAVKLGSPGPIIFKQRRYGLDGEEILVYKFRSMTVTEDGGVVTQAKKNDSRITPLGAILRRTSLDELPQFINVLQGRMSIVGPRPHAVAHNELYRKLIKGYMVRHKVKPGITGWAQVNGYRGETETLDKMQGRIDYDLDYLRNWSLRLDIHIILKTVRLVAKDQQAY
ncbi:putative colanic acid biosynthesis UDP-glucose lipid carrier transferase [Rhodoferax saidenbachensis]|uniref:Colanic acid biosynthesis UDP-glucose lipid carrier transferase n=1 Tax=Rhodoferax saidenbachensis TaxID=1484693 RepID=A0ABU1ZJR1_9BURK|nr:putative colanic acid biosynthesis UDP-glucose lipid carrier transferase [Rhodoferax saidenbachensis]